MSKKHPKNRCRKYRIFLSFRLQKWREMRSKSGYKSMQKSIPKKTGKTWKTRRSKTWISAQNAILLFKFKVRAVRERSEICIEKGWKIEGNSIRKSMTNQCKIDARKSDAKMMENERKWSPNGSQNPLKINKTRKKTRSENRCEKRTALRRSPGQGWPQRQPKFKKISFGKTTRKKTNCRKSIWRKTKRIAQENYRKTSKEGVQKGGMQRWSAR